MHDLVDKKTAFKKVRGEKNIAIKNPRPRKMRFTRRWFRNRNQVTFSTFLTKRFNGKRPVRMIQIGVFEGMDLAWQFQNTLTHSDSRVLAVDPWLPTTKLDAETMDVVCERARNNLKEWRKKLRIERGISKDVLRAAVQKPVVIYGQSIPAGSWDLIVIDGDHHARVVLSDAIFSLQLLKPGGLVVFDDVRNRTTKKKHVATGLQWFLDEHSNDVKFEWAHRYCNAYSKR